jgi:hypothetical protein
MKSFVPSLKSESRQAAKMEEGRIRLEFRSSGIIFSAAMRSSVRLLESLALIQVGFSRSQSENEELGRGE